MGQTILLFDVDGTLLSAGGADRRAVLRAFRELWDVDAAVDGVRVHGRTDLDIVGEIFRTRMGRSPRIDELELLCGRYLAYLEEELATSPDFRVLPGVLHLLDSLSATPDTVIGLATGNLEQAATLKLRRAKLLGKFRFGAFGSEVEEREKLIALAIDRGKALLPSQGRSPRIFVIGDTTLDITAGKRLKIWTVAVATGGDSIETLAAEDPDYVLPDLSHPHLFLKILEATRGVWHPDGRLHD